METLNSGQRYQLLHNTEEKNLQLSPGKLTVYQTENTTTPKKKKPTIFNTTESRAVG